MVRNSDRHQYRELGEALCAESSREQRTLREATDEWHRLMLAQGYKPRIAKAAPIDGVPKRIGPAVVPMGGSSSGSV